MLSEQLSVYKYHRRASPNKVRTSEEALRGVYAYPESTDIGILGDEDIWRLYRRGAKHIVTCDISARNCEAIAAQLDHVGLLDRLSGVTVELKRENIFDVIPRYDRIHSVFFDFEKCLHPRETSNTGNGREQLDLWKPQVLMTRLTPQAHVHFTYARSVRQQGHESMLYWRDAHLEFARSMASKLPVDTSHIDWELLEPEATSLWFAMIVNHMFGYTTDSAILAEGLFDEPEEGFLVDGEYRNYNDKGRVPMQTTWFSLALVDNPAEHLEKSLTQMQVAFARTKP